MKSRSDSGILCFHKESLASKIFLPVINKVLKSIIKCINIIIALIKCDSFFQCWIHTVLCFPPPLPLSKRIWDFVFSISFPEFYISLHWNHKKCLNSTLVSLRKFLKIKMQIFFPQIAFFFFFSSWSKLASNNKNILDIIKIIGRRL